MAILIDDKVDFRTKKFIRDKCNNKIINQPRRYNGPKCMYTK